MPRPSRPFHGSDTPNKPLKLPKGKVERIDFGPHEQEIKRIWEGKPSLELIRRWQRQGLDRVKQERYYNPGSEKSRYCKLQRMVGYGNNLIGYCSMCKNLNTHILRQKIDGAIIVTRYCKEHVPT